MKPNSKPRCPHCGHFALTEAEECILAALYTARTWPTLAELARVVKCTDRTVRRAISALPSLIMSDDSDGGGAHRYQLTLEGRAAVENLAGRDTVAA